MALQYFHPLKTGNKKLEFSPETGFFGLEGCR